MIERKKKYYKSENKDILYSAMQMSRIYSYLSEIEKKQKNLSSLAYPVETPVTPTVGITFSEIIRFKAIVWVNMDATHKMVYYIRDKKLRSLGIYEDGEICGVDVWGGKDYPSGYSISLHDIIYEEEEDNCYPFWSIGSYLGHLGFSNVMNYYNIRTRVELREDDG